ncbi:MAG: DegV family protein, partial [Methylocystaceae bacterium]
MAVKLITDSTSYIDAATQQDLDIKIISLSVHFPDESFEETQVDYDYFYNKIERDNVIPTSSQPSPASLYTAIKGIVDQGDDVLGVFISAKMSGTYDTALSAKNMVLEENPQARIEIIDSKTNCMSMGLQIVEAALAAKAGKTMDELLAIVQQISNRVRFYFVPASLQYLIRGGRIGGASALIGSLLQIRPILFVNDGMTDVFDRVRGTRKAVNRMLQKLDDDVKKYGIKHLLVHHISDEEQGWELAEHLSHKY